MINHDVSSFVMMTSGVSGLVSFTVPAVNGRLTSSLPIRMSSASCRQERHNSTPWGISRLGEVQPPLGRLGLLLLQQACQELRNGAHP